MRLSILLLVFCIPSLLTAQRYAEVYQSAMQAREQGDTTGFLRKMQEADSLRPLHPVILFRLGTAYILNSEWDAGMERLKHSLMLNASMPVQEEPDLAVLRDQPAYQSLLAFRDSLLKPVVHSEVAFSIHERDLHIEGIAFDPVDRRWYAGSVHKRKIITWDASGEVQDFTGSAENGLMSVMGMDVDPQRRILWVTSVPSREMIDHKVKMPAFIRAYDLTTGEIISSHSPSDTLDHWFGDLQVSSDGDVFITDSSTNRIYLIRNGTISVWLDLSDTVGNIQGIALREDDLVVTDYLSSLFIVNLDDRQITAVSNPYHELILKGADGIYAHGSTLLLTINGQVPNRLIRLYMEGDSISHYEILDRNHPEFGEPTLGTVVGDVFYYVGNSSWGAYDQDGTMNESELPVIRILKADLRE